MKKLTSEAVPVPVQVETGGALTPFELRTADLVDVTGGHKTSSGYGEGYTKKKGKKAKTKKPKH